MRLESSGDSLARVVNARGETVGIVTLERLREPLFLRRKDRRPCGEASVNCDRPPCCTLARSWAA